MEELIDNDPAGQVVEIGSQYGGAVGNHNTIYNNDMAKWSSLEDRIQLLEQELQQLKQQLSDL
jgi:hypothetical protein